MLKTKTAKAIILLVTSLLFLGAAPCMAQEDSPEAAEKLMRFQMEALKNGDYQKFIAHGNQAFKTVMDEYSFESLVMQRKARIARGYRLEYLGAIRTIGMFTHLWAVQITDDKYQLLGRLSVSRGKVVGFDLE